MSATALTVMLTFVCSALLCGVYLRLARRWQILDVPNERSSHEHPTPRGGGLPLMLSFFFGVALVFGPSVFWSSQYSAVLLGTLFLTLLGLVDDNWTLSSRLRFFAYGICSVLAAAALLSAGGTTPGLLFIFCTAFVILWALNLYNFMDGVDGLAATQCFLACCAVAVLSWGNGGAPGYSVFCLLLGFSHLGFLLWNWPGARLFMGDAGSVSTGFLLATLAVLGATQGYLSFFCWVVLLAVFITDASWTLCWRLLSRQKFTQPHRSHAYQRLSRRWGSHWPVVILLIAINGLWLFPLAGCIALWPQYTPVFVTLAYLPLLLGMAKIHSLE